MTSYYGPTAIPWATRVWHPIAGCDNTLPCAERCWACRLAAMRLRHDPKYRGLAYPTNEGRYVWTGEVRCFEEALKIRRPRKPQVIFVAPMGDLFHPEVPTVFALQAVAMASVLAGEDGVALIVTKRPERIAEIWRGQLPASWDWSRGSLAPHGVWLCVSAGTQAELDKRVSAICDPSSPAFWPGHKVAMLEPQVEEIDFARARAAMWLQGSIGHLGAPGTDFDDNGIEWIVQGCESGQDRRPFEIDWARLVRDQCAAAGVPYWYKQQVGPSVCEPGDPYSQERCAAKSCEPACARDRRWLRVCEAPLLDGRQHLDAPPEIAAILKAGGKSVTAGTTAAGEGAGGPRNGGTTAADEGVRAP